MFSGIYHSAQAALMLLCGVMTGFLYDIFLPPLRAALRRPFDMLSSAFLPRRAAFLPLFLRFCRFFVAICRNASYNKLYSGIFLTGFTKEKGEQA